MNFTSKEIIQNPTPLSDTLSKVSFDNKYDIRTLDFPQIPCFHLGSMVFWIFYRLIKTGFFLHRNSVHLCPVKFLKIIEVLSYCFPYKTQYQIYPGG